jgi:pimeloyl-ACP methyl ester carboxylesterase
LYTERVARGEPSKWLLFAHGIYGAGANWRTIAKKITEQRPGWGVVLVDLRGHGRSPPGDPPHTLDAAAHDLPLAGVTALAGHSFGGKVVLAARSFAKVEQTWVLDATPSARPEAMHEGGSVVRVLELLERSPKHYAKREDFISAVVAAGHAKPLAQWLAMNLAPADDGYDLRLDPAQLRALLESYFATDLWDALFDPSHGDVEYVIAEQSTSLDASARERLAHAPSHVHVHRVPTDHWLHIEAPDAVVALFVQQLR